jgi:diguanylate cyclase (GGDEF)-like protein
MVTCIFALTLGYWSWYHGNPQAKYFCLAWTSAFVGVAILIASKFGILPATFWTNNAGQIGVLAQVALLSFALASRFNREKELRIRAQESSLDHERLARRTQEELLRAEAHAKVKLEQKVIERTENLQTALTELESVNEKLKIMSTTDALTGLYNRGHFETCFTHEFNRATRHKRQLSIVLCDIDHFKSINDQNGHKAGDECLQALARLFKKRLTRADDLIARYGGEEFIVLLSDTSMSQAKVIAEDLRLSLQNMYFEFQGKRIPVTASFGISSLNSLDTQSADQLVTQADVALYRAKDAGRNQVVCWNPRELDSPASNDEIVDESNKGA